MLIANFFAVFGLLLSYLAPYVHPQTFWPLAFFGMGYFPILVINLLFIVIWVILRRWWSLLSLLTILFGWNNLRDHVGFNGSIPKEVVKQANPEHLRVMSYNVHLFSAPEFDAKPFTNKNAVLDVIQSAAPDVLCIQEFHTRFKGENNLIKRIRENLGLGHHFVLPAAENELEAYGLGIFSRYPIVETGTIEGHNYGINRMMYVDILKDDQKFRVYNVHLRSIGFQKEDYEFINNPTGTFNQDIQSTLMIGGRLKNAFHLRSAQVDALFEHSKSVDHPHIIVGDFNDTPLSYAVHTVSQKMKNTFREKGQGWGTTYNGDFPNFQIDFIFVHPDFNVHNYQIIKQKISDHFPIWTDLSLIKDESN